MIQRFKDSEEICKRNFDTRKMDMKQATASDAINTFYHRKHTQQYHINSMTRKIGKV